MWLHRIFFFIRINICFFKTFKFNCLDHCIACLFKSLNPYSSFICDFCANPSKTMDSSPSNDWVWIFHVFTQLFLQVTAQAAPGNIYRIRFVLYWLRLLAWWRCSTDWWLIPSLMKRRLVLPTALKKLPPLWP